MKPKRKVFNAGDIKDLAAYLKKKKPLSEIVSFARLGLELRRKAGIPDKKVFVYEADMHSLLDSRETTLIYDGGEGSCVEVRHRGVHFTHASNVWWWKGLTANMKK